MKLRLVLCATSVAFAQENPELSLSGKSYLDASTNFEGEERTFENWTDVHGEYGNFSSNLGLTVFEPARSFSRDTTSPGVAFANMEWQSDQGTTLKVGHFYAQLGNGIILRSYRDYPIRWDNSLLGFYWQNRTRFTKATALSAKARDLDGTRYAPVHAGEFVIMPWNAMEIGVGGVATQNLDLSEQKWASVQGKFSHYGEFLGGGLKSEYALRDENPDAKALYVTGDLLVGPISWVTEFKDYRDFDVSNGAPLNNAPMAAKEHIFSLMARKQLQASAKNIMGYTSELSSKLPVEFAEFALRASMTRAFTDTSKSGKHGSDYQLFDEYFGQVECNQGSLGIVIGGGWQKDVEETHLNAVYSGNFPLSDNYFVKTIFEHQHATVRLTGKESYSQIYRLTLSMFRKLSLGVVTEQWVQAKQGTTLWPGLQADWHVNDGTSLTAFAGLRRAGKDCSGGVCVSKPEFEGLELIGNLSF